MVAIINPLQTLLVVGAAVETITVATIAVTVTLVVDAVDRSAMLVQIHRRTSRRSAETARRLVMKLLAVGTAMMTTKKIRQNSRSCHRWIWL